MVAARERRDTLGALLALDVSGSGQKVKSSALGVMELLYLPDAACLQVFERRKDHVASEVTPG